MQSQSNSTPTAAAIFARSQGTDCVGNGYSRCHWCSSPCNGDFHHDDPPPIPFIRSRSTAKCPTDPYICTGCWLWRRKHVTVTFLAGGMLDRQEARNHSWWITEENAWALRTNNDFKALFHLLVKPPKRFVLALRAPGENIDTLIQLAVANDPGGIIAETPLHYTLNNIPLSFTVYELIEAIRNGPAPYGPGVNTLWAFLGEPPDELKLMYPPIKDEEDKRGRGRPAPKNDAKNTTKKLVTCSGV
jgi:hypothetical protein